MLDLNKAKDIINTTWDFDIKAFFDIKNEHVAHQKILSIYYSDIIKMEICQDGYFDVRVINEYSGSSMLVMNQTINERLSLEISLDILKQIFRNYLDNSILRKSLIDGNTSLFRKSKLQNIGI